MSHPAITRYLPEEGAHWRAEAIHQAARYRSIGASATVDLRFLLVEAGGRLLPHAVARDRLYVCLEGSGVLECGGQRETIRAGQVVRLAGGVVRSLANAGEGRLLLIELEPPEPSVGQWVRWRRKAQRVLLRRLRR